VSAVRCWSVRGGSIPSAFHARLSVMPPTLRRRLLRAGPAVVVGVLAVACSSDRQTLSAPSLAQPEDSVPTSGTGVGEIDSVAMVGDSITVRSEAPVADGFRDLGLDVRAIDAASGRRMTAEGGSDGSGLGAVIALAAADPPDLWVIALGSNDVLQYDGAEEYRAQIVTLLSALPADAPVVWVDTYLEDDPERSDQFNQALRDTLAYRGTSSVADWAAVAPGDGVLSDGIHPSDEGTHQFADVVMAAVEQWTG
jgi:lysophospholipase L1-like esterase